MGGAIVMNYFKKKENGFVFAYDDEQLLQVARLTELELLLQEKEPLFISVKKKLDVAFKELQDAEIQLQQFISATPNEELGGNEEISQLTQSVDTKTSEYNTALIELSDIEQDYQSLKGEYEATLPVFFDIREHLKILKKMTDKEVQAYLNPQKPKEQHIAEADQQRKILLSEAAEAIAPLQDAADLDMATDEEIALLKEWKKYRVLLNRIDTSLAPDIDWPQKP